MNKKLLASAVIAAVAVSPAAFAESVVYGKMHTSVDVADYDLGRDNTEVTNRSSRLGFKGSEDLGGGLKALYQIEFGIRSDGGQEQVGSDGHTTLRNTFVGLASDWGTLIVGRHDTPMKMAFYGSGNERLGDSIIDLNRNGFNANYRNNPIGVFQEFRANNAIAYVSPNFSGFTVTGAVMPGEQSGTAEFRTTGPTTAPVVTSIKKNDRDSIDHWSVGAMYKGNGLKASMGYEYLVDQPTATFRTPGEISENVNQKTFQAGASYTMNNYSFGAQFQTTDNAGFVYKDDYDAWALTGKATFGNNAVSLIYTHSKLDPRDSSSYKTDGYGISADHSFSKRTKAYVAYAYNEGDGVLSGKKDPESKTFSLGMIHNF